MWTREEAVKREVVAIDCLFYVLPKNLHDDNIAANLVKCRLKQVVAREKAQKALQQQQSC